jgi:hypothetical protein
MSRARGPRVAISAGALHGRYNAGLRDYLITGTGTYLLTDAFVLDGRITLCWRGGSTTYAAAATVTAKLDPRVPR